MGSHVLNGIEKTQFDLLSMSQKLRNASSLPKSTSRLNVHLHDTRTTGRKCFRFLWRAERAGDAAVLRVLVTSDVAHLGVDGDAAIQDAAGGRTEQERS